MPDSFEDSVRGEPKARINGVWAAVAQVAGGQYGVISLDQLLTTNLSYAEVKGWVRRGLLIPLHRGVYAIGHKPLIMKAYLIAALLATGEEAFLSHRTAAAVWGLREVSTRRIDVTVPGCRRRSRGTLRIHSSAAPNVTTRNGLRVSSFAQMLSELAPVETRRELDRLITEGVRRGFFDLATMQLALRGRRPGRAKLEAVLAGYVPKPDRKSGLERAFDELLAQHPEIPEPQRNIYIHGWEIDCYWPEHKLAVELDGRPYHIAVKDMEKDRVKDAKLLRLGIRTLRITDTRFELDPLGVLDDLLAALALG